jgi:hypothetical protein
MVDALPHNAAGKADRAAALRLIQRAS